MRLLYQVNEPVIGDNGGEMLASFDITEKTDTERAEVLDALMVAYPNKKYKQHQCQHDDNKSCVEVEI